METLESYEYTDGAELVAWLHEQAENTNFPEISEDKWFEFYP